MGASEVCISVAFVVLQCYRFASLGYFQCYISCKLCVCYCTGIWTGAATRQLWCSQGADTRFTICCVSVADACDICDVVVSGPYLRHCNPPGGGSLDSGPEPGMRQDADRDPYAEDRREGRLGSTSGCQGPSISGRESIWIESLVGRLPDCVSECGCCRRDIWYRCLAMPGSPCI